MSLTRLSPRVLELVAKTTTLKELQLLSFGQRIGRRIARPLIEGWISDLTDEQLARIHLAPTMRTLTELSPDKLEVGPAVRKWIDFECLGPHEASQEELGGYARRIAGAIALPILEDLIEGLTEAELATVVDRDNVRAALFALAPADLLDRVLTDKVSA